MKDLTDEIKMAETAGNKSLEEIEKMLNILDLSIRLYASRHLMDNDENNPLDIYAELDHNAVGLSSLEIPHATKIFQSKTEGIICVVIEGIEEPYDFEDLDIHDRLSIIKEL